MADDLVGELLRQGEAHARRILIERREKDLAPFYHLVSPDEGGMDAIIMATWGNDIQKQLIVLAVKAKAREMGAIGALFVGEGWLVKSPEVHLTPWHQRQWLNRVGPPSQNPDRVECVEIMATDGERYDGLLLQMVRDKPGGRIIALVTDSEPTAVRGRLIDGIIPRKGAP